MALYLLIIINCSSSRKSILLPNPLIFNCFMVYGIYSPKNKGYRVGEVPERPKGTDCKSVGDAFGGSNPPLSTRPASGRSDECIIIDDLPFTTLRWMSRNRLGTRDEAFIRISRRVRIVKATENNRWAGIAQMAERQPSKLRVAGSIPVSRSIFLERGR